jgi:GrpB-like predicted nucleotidyltransferase (UPF0157 family)
MEAELLCQGLGSLALRIEHVGSTSVPDLEAKPVIDIQVSVASLDRFLDCQLALADLGYTHISLGDFDQVYPFFQKPAEWPASHHIHLCEVGGEQESKHLLFCDYLRRSPLVAQQYAQLKKELASQFHGQTHQSRESYSLAKSDFVRSALAQARLGLIPDHARSNSVLLLHD